MQDGGRRWQLVVPTGGDTLRQERLTRDLYAALHGTEGVLAGFAEDDATSRPGHKGVGAGEVALWAATATAVARPASQILITAIKEWCARDRHRKVEVTYDGHSVAITGRPDAAQERVVREFLDKVGDAPSNGSEGDGE
ncbi:hypothetical protein J8N05_14565 [Streptomyces sp. BH-SS-21]|uniref:Uncharacterized protein n=1 Tax=Streptomyces liliiviolaceus TaxID=2823109 RepID=A0A940XT35_9ACTN|nr:hypothetical protein [Streptomyces liliiviolaceus]MBQ0849425.1 hypothetical protein [Streptomyces liliiviolaceus]